jgi:hypothetical protein
MRLISALMEVILSASLSLLCQYENGEITSATFVFKISQLFEFRSVILYDFCSTILAQRAEELLRKSVLN